MRKRVSVMSVIELKNIAQLLSERGGMIDQNYEVGSMVGDCGGKVVFRAFKIGPSSWEVTEYLEAS